MLRRTIAFILMMASVWVTADSDVAVQQADETFADYRARLTEHFFANKQWVDAANKQQEVDAVLPFEHIPESTQCESEKTVGLLMFHGLSDSPFALRDPAKALAQYCIHTRVMLLPGHGSRAENLIDVTRDDWREAVSQAVTSFSKDVDRLYLGGFSTGGALVTEYAWLHPQEIEGVVLFAPLFKINSGIDWLAPILAPVVDWLDYNEPDDYAKYASIPVPAIAEAYQLAKEVRRSVLETPPKLPVLIALSEEDATVDSDVTMEVYQQSMMKHPDSHLILYSTTQATAEKDRYDVVHSILPEQRIHGLSHMAVHGGPENPYYGADGSYRNCSWYYADVEQYDACRTTESNWFGERGDALAERSAVAARLSWNPYFDALMQRVALFMGAEESNN